MSGTDEIYLLKNLKEGDIHALEVIFNRHYSNLCRYLLLLFKNQILVEHIAQDIFVYIWENRKNIEVKTSLESYIFAAGRYKALNQLRNEKRQKVIREDLTINTEILETLDTEIERAELERIIEKAISSLPERCQQIFRLSKEEGMNYKDIAVLLNISVNTVEGQMAIALKKLRNILRPFYLRILLFT